MAVSAGAARVEEDELPLPEGSQGPSVTHDALLSLPRCLGARHQAEVYLSAPITTGAQYLAWRRTPDGSLQRDHPEYRERHRAQVVQTNIARIAPLVRSLRERFAGQLVIDPTGLADVEGWKQDDYHELWCAVVETYAQTVVFADGWQYSTGCAAEFGAALRVRARLLTERLEPLASAEGLALLAAAVAEMEAMDEETAAALHRKLAAARLAAGGTDDAQAH